VTLLRRFATVLVVFALALAACSRDEEIARVGGTSIYLSDIQSLYVREQPIDDAFRQALLTRIVFEAAAVALTADFGVSVDQAAVDAYLSQFEAAIARTGDTPAEALGVEDASMEMVRFDARVAALRDAVIEQLAVAPETVDAIFADPATLTEVCVKHILVATPEEAETVKARLAAGEDFATVAGEVSLDTNAEGGDLGCALAGDYVDEFAEGAMAATLNEVAGPIETEFGHHLLVVSERTTPTRLEYLAAPLDILSAARASILLREWITAAVGEADIWVAEAYGAWNGSTIDPPGGSTSTSTTGATTTSTTAATTTTGG